MVSLSVRNQAFWGFHQLVLESSSPDLGSFEWSPELDLAQGHRCCHMVDGSEIWPTR